MATSFSMIPSPTGCFEEPREARYSEPYVLVTSIDLRPARPRVDTFLYGPWKSANPKATAGIIPLVWRESFWELEILAAPMAKPDDVIFLVALMEHVNGSPSAARVLVKKAIIEELDMSAGMAQGVRIARLIDKTNKAVDSANGGPNVTSAIGLLLRSEDMEHLNGNGSRTFVRSFSGYGGHYCLRLELIKAESDLQFVPRDNDAFARAAK